MNEEQGKFLHINGRNGFEFDARIRDLVKERAAGLCEWPEGCTNPHNGSIDHITGIRLGRILEIPAEELTSICNAQMLCERHADIKFTQEQIFIRILEMELRNFQLERALVFWDEMKRPNKNPLFVLRERPKIW